MPELKLFSSRTINTIEMHKNQHEYFEMSVLCLGWSQSINLLMYLILLLYTTDSAKPPSMLKSSLQVFLGIAMLFTIVYGIVLIMATIKRSYTLMEVALQLCLSLILVDLSVGILGVVVYSTGQVFTINFVLLLVYVFLLLEIMWSICFDMPHLVIYQQLIVMNPNRSPHGSGSQSPTLSPSKTRSTSSVQPETANANTSEMPARYIDTLRRL